MSVQNDDSGKRWIQVEVDVPGTPEEVWEAIATGPGISSWFMPVGTNEDGEEPRVGGDITMGSGEHKQKVGEYTEWDPPRTFVAEGKSWGPDGPTVAHQWTVEAQAGGTCKVRIVNSYFEDDGDWDNQLTDLLGGWPRFFRILQLYMTHFRAQPCSAIHLIGPTTMTKEETWETLAKAFGIQDAKEGSTWSTSIPDCVQLSGTVDTVTETPARSAVLHLESPVRGIASPITITATGAPVMYGIGIYLYGDGAAEFVSQHEPSFQSWIMKTFHTENQ